MKKRVECKITGRVQLVMFRDFTMRKARSLGVLGFVQNRKDGSVFAICEGEEDTLKKLLELLKKGSVLSKVKDVEVSWHEATGEFLDFKINYE